ncbi:MAG TPA: C39 family peptidase [Candidatus Paceibacterota bacterium]
MKNNLVLYSQSLDLNQEEWQRSGCGIASLGMILGNKISDLNELYQLGLDTNAYLPGIGWKHQGLVDLAKHFGFLSSYNLDLAQMDTSEALAKLKDELKNGPVIVSVFAHYEHGHKEGHLIVLSSLNDSEAEVLDPAAPTREDIHQLIPTEKFVTGWKKRLIVVRL